MKTPDRVLSDAMPEERHHKDCGCRECKPDRSSVLDITREKRLEKLLTELKSYFERGLNPTCCCSKCASFKKWFDEINKVMG